MRSGTETMTVFCPLLLSLVVAATVPIVGIVEIVVVVVVVEILLLLLYYYYNCYSP